MSPKALITSENMASLENDDVEKWLDNNPAFFKDYFIRKVCIMLINSL